jgi:glutathione S-transferase
MRIAEYIEKTYPDRPFATAALLVEQQEHVDTIRKNVAGQFCALIIPGAVKNFDGPSVEYSNTTRSGFFGMARIFDSYQSPLTR